MTYIPDDIDLVKGLRDNDPEAFKELFNRYHARVYTFALRIVPAASDAEEVVQEVFMAVWKQRNSLVISSSLISYLFGIAKHMVCKLVQQKIRYEAFTEYYLDQNQEYAFITEETVLFQELSDRVEQLLLELPERRRQIFLLSRHDELSYAEIAHQLGISENTVDTQIRHALNFLRGRISRP
jgi:RNA polymerase sigma-70 factor (ECF subfamily)